MLHDELAIRDSAKGWKIVTSMKSEWPLVPISSISGRDRCYRRLGSTVGLRHYLRRSEATNRTWESWRVLWNLSNENPRW